MRFSYIQAAALVWGLATGIAHAQDNLKPGQEPPALTVALPGDATMKFVRIPAGVLAMGSPESEVGRDADEGPVHEITLSEPFYLGVHEVTQEQWKAVMGNIPAEFQPRGQHPVEKVSWDDCMEFIAKMNELQQGEFRLPTEAEWEYACRAGTETRFHWGRDRSELEAVNYAWFEKNAGLTTHAVGQKKPNAWGLHDMSGNVWEWCQDLYAEYPNQPLKDSKGPKESRARVSRGGGWRYGAQYCRSADRYYARHDVRSYFIGLRLLRTCP